MNNELVYPLNLPNIFELLLPDINVYKKEFEGVGSRIYPIDILAPEWRNWMGIPWDYIIMFYKTDGFRPKFAHIDTNRQMHENVWGINFHIGGAGLLELYRYEDVTQRDKLAEHLRQGVLDYIIDKPPIKSYYMPEGAYLVINSLPHRATGYDKRFCFSLRSTSMYDRDPKEIIEIFKDYIIDKPLLNKAPD
jgi:hypothetical protein